MNRVITVRVSKMRPLTSEVRSASKSWRITIVLNMCDVYDATDLKFVSRNMKHPFFCYYVIYMVPF